MKRTTLLAVGFATLALAPSSFAGPGATTIFSDDFETGALSLWTASAGSSLEATNYASADATLGLFGAYANVSADRMHHNIIANNGGQELSGRSAVTAWIYDSADPRAFVQTLGYTGTGLPDGGTAANGTLAQLLAIGKNNSVSATGEIFDATKYQARVLYGSFSGWFNLDDPGAPSRSPGWHKFTIEREADDTTLKFYVDDVLARTVTDATPQSWDTITMGIGSGSTPSGTAYDNISVAVIPEPTSFGLGLLGLGFLACWRRIKR